MRISTRPKTFQPYETQLLNAIYQLAEEIASRANLLPMADGQDYIDRQLALFAVQMQKYEVLAATPSVSIGYAIDSCLRDQIEARLTR